MKKLLTLFCLVLILSIAFSGCTPAVVEPVLPIEPTPPIDPTITETINLYYGDTDNALILIEARPLSYLPTEDKYSMAVEELISGPTMSGVTTNIDPLTVVYGTILQNDYIIINLSSHFNMFSGSMNEFMSVASVVNTLTQFPEITKAKILVEGAELIAPSGDPRGFMDPFPLQP